MTARALVDDLRRWPADAFEELLCALEPAEAVALAYAWEGFWARPDQLAPPGDWVYWLLFGGKGSGKTRSATQWVIARARLGLGPIRLIAGTDDDVRDTMVEGVSGILAHSPPDFMPLWEPSKGAAGRLTWPNGVQARGFSAEEPKRLHGKAGQTDWYDDLTGWKSRAKETFDMAAFGLREGDARCVITSNPEESELILSLLDDDTRPIVRTDSETDQNLVNLAPALQSTLKQFEGTALELRHRKGVMIRTSSANPFRGLEFDKPPIRVAEPGELVELVVGVDPAEGSSEKHDEWGIGCAGKRIDKHVVGLEDASNRYDSDAAGAMVLEVLDRWADRFPNARRVIVAEKNRGEDRVRSTINAAYWKRVHEGKSRRPPPEIIGVRAKDGKDLRAGDLRGLYLAGLLHHLPGMARCETQQRGWNPLAPKGPAQDDRIDWLTHAVHHLGDLAVINEPCPQCASLGRPADHCRQCHQSPCACSTWTGESTQPPAAGPPLIGSPMLGGGRDVASILARLGARR